MLNIPLPMSFLIQDDHPISIWTLIRTLLDLDDGILKILNGRLLFERVNISRRRHYGLTDRTSYPIYLH